MNLPDLEEPEADDSSRPFEVTYGGKGRNITGDSVQEYMAQREREEAYLQQQYMQSGYVPPTPPQYEPQYDPHHFRQESFHRPPTQWQAQPQALCLAFRQNQMLPHWFNDDDIVDVTPVVPPVYPVALRPTDSMVLPTIVKKFNNSYKTRTTAQYHSNAIYYVAILSKPILSQSD